MLKIYGQKIINSFSFNLNDFSFKFMTSNFLKIVAVVSMFVDHFGVFGWYPPLETYFIMRKIGRIAFVTYAFLTCIAMYNTRKPVFYLIKMLTIAIIFQVVVIIVNNWVQFSQPYYLNIFFVIFFGALTIYALRKHWIWGIIAFVLIMLIYFAYVNANSLFKIDLSHNFTIDYTLYGYLTISAMGLCFYFRKKMPTVFFKLILCTSFIFINVLFYNVSFSNVYLARFWNIGSLQIYCLWVLPLFIFYNSRDHYKNNYIKWAFTTSYPLSFIVPMLIFTFIK